MTARFVALVAVIGLLAGTTAAQDKGKSKDKGGSAEKAMEMMQGPHTQPGPAHEVFKLYAGKWDYVVKFWMDPSAPPMEMPGKGESKIIMGGRFLSDHAMSADDGQSFEGRGWWGYDNTKKKYWYAWIDSMTTSLTKGEGSWDAKTNTMTWIGESFDPMENATIKMKEVSHVKSDGTIHKTFYKIVGGKETKTMEINYTKAK